MMVLPVSLANHHERVPNHASSEVLMVMKLVMCWKKTVVRKEVKKEVMLQSSSTEVGSPRVTIHSPDKVSMT